MYDDDELDPGALKCTPKCQTALTSDNTLNCRTRQYCLLLTRGDELSQKVSEKLSAKIDVPALLQAGYLESDNPKFNQNKADSIETDGIDMHKLSANASLAAAFNSDKTVESASDSRGLFKPCVNSAPTQRNSLSLEEYELSPTLQWIAGNH